MQLLARRWAIAIPLANILAELLVTA